METYPSEPLKALTTTESAAVSEMETEIQRVRMENKSQIKVAAVDSFQGA